MGLSKMFDVLYVEDKRSQIRLVEEAVAESVVSARLHAVRTGSTALDILGSESTADRGLRPDLVRLDLDLPESSGFEVIAVG